MADPKEIIQLYYALGKSTVLCTWKVNNCSHLAFEKNPSDVIPSKQQIREIVKKFQVYGTVYDKKNDN